ncbi:MAG: ATP-binding protein [bacterium]|nr:ATP-binding protein [bacterium]
MKVAQLVIYRKLKYQELLSDMEALLSCEQASEEESSRLAGQLVELADHYGLEGNLWHSFLALCLANHENAFSTACEIRGEVSGSVNALARHDFQILMELFQMDIKKLGGIWEFLSAYEQANDDSKVFNKRIRNRMMELAAALEAAKTVEVFKAAVTEFYREFGVGKFGLNKAFRVLDAKEPIVIEPITNVEHVYLDDLVGYESQKRKLVENTEAFIEGRAANNCLLFGDSGTGKSSSIKAILNTYYERGLRMIEIYKHQFRCLSDVIEQVKDRNYKFIIYMDDLSFEESELEYKYLKAIIEGGLGKRPQNVLIYATSNRRHLIREKFSDKRELDDELHMNDTVQEKLSLAARFGVTIYFGMPNKTEFQKIVLELAKRRGIAIAEDELLLLANQWELHHGGMSGRSAEQFIIWLQGRA